MTLALIIELITVILFPIGLIAMFIKPDQTILATFILAPIIVVLYDIAVYFNL